MSEFEYRAKVYKMNGMTNKELIPRWRVMSKPKTKKKTKNRDIVAAGVLSPCHGVEMTHYDRNLHYCNKCRKDYAYDESTGEMVATKKL